MVWWNEHKRSGLTKEEKVKEEITIVKDLFLSLGAVHKALSQRSPADKRFVRHTGPVVGLARESTGEENS